MPDGNSLHLNIMIIARDIGVLTQLCPTIRLLKDIWLGTSISTRVYDFEIEKIWDDYGVPQDVYFYVPSKNE